MGHPTMQENDTAKLTPTYKIHLFFLYVDRNTYIRRMYAGYPVKKM